MQAATATRPRLEATVRHGPGWSAVALVGIIDEHNDLSALPASLQGPKVVFDLGGVRRINSVGVRDWVQMITALRGAGFEPVLDRCSPAIMEQVNLIRNFTAGAKVTAFYAPYYCDRCDLEEDHLVDALDLAARGVGRAPEFPCDKPACAKAFDDVEETYFAFLEDQPPSGTDGPAADLVQQARAALEGAAGSGLSGHAPTPAVSLAAPALAPARPKPLLAVTPPPHHVPGARAPAAHAPGAPQAPPPVVDPDGIRASDVFFIAFVLVVLGLIGFVTWHLLTLE